MKPSSSHQHGGHRARMRNRYFETGLSGFQPHEALELILYCTIPKKDVNPLAHTLLDTFGTVDAVLCASDEELLSISGIGQRTCDLLHALSDACDYYSAARYSGTRTIVNLETAVRISRMLSRQHHTRELLIFFENHAGTLLSVRCYPGRPNDPAVIRSILSAALSANAYSAVIALNDFHPLRRLSRTETDALFPLLEALAGIDIYVIDFVLLSGDHICSLRSIRMLQDEHSSFRTALPRLYEWLGPIQENPEDSGWHHISVFGDTML